MQEFRANLEPGNSDGHTVLRYLVEARQMPLEMAIEKVYAAVAKYAADYKGSQSKLMGGMILTGVLGLPIFFPFGITSLLIAGAIGASAYGWQEFGAMRDRLLPEYQALKNSVLLAQFIKWLAEELKERRSAEAPGSFQPDVLAPAQIIAAYEHTVIAISNGEHLSNNASDPVLALFVLKLRQHTNQVPGWVVEAFQQLESSERQRAADVGKAEQYMWGNLEERYPDRFNKQKTIGQNTKLGAVEVPAQVVEGEDEQSLGKPDLLLLNEVQDEPGVSDSPPTTNNSQPVEQPASKVDLTSEQAGLEILDAIVKSRRSTLLIGDTGAGKSVSQAYILSKLFDLHPDAEVFVLAQKADSFCGLADKGRVILFDPTEPEHALILIGDIWSIYDRRRRLPEADRPNLPPVRLILADWLSINQALEELLREEPVKSSKYLTKLADIIYNGRELNVCLLVDLQSYNLAAVGLKADRNSRKNFNLIGLGNYSIDELGMVNESYGVLINLIGDRYIVASESERTALNASFNQLQPISKAHQRPIIFSGLSPARLVLLPDLRKYKMTTVSVKISEENSATAIPDNIRERLEVLIKATPEDKIPPQSELARKLLEIIQAATKYPISFESIRKSRKWEGNPPDKSTLLATLEGISPDWIRGSEEEGYYIQD
jgi:hypothetical protein